jgi:hypothetical protein
MRVGDAIAVRPTPPGPIGGIDRDAVIDALTEGGSGDQSQHSGYDERAGECRQEIDPDNAK